MVVIRGAETLLEEWSSWAMNHSIRGLPRDDILGVGGGRHIIAREQGPLAKADR